MGMTDAILNIGPWQLALTLVFVLLAGGASLLYGLGLCRDLAIGTVRAFAQLFLVGYILVFIFELDSGLPVMAAFLVMVAVAVHTVRGRVKEKSISFALPTFISMLASYFLVSFMVTGMIVQAKPWWTPQYFIPIAGMIAGNSMNALAISLDRLFSDLRSRRAEVEMKLALGADYEEASRDIVRGAIRAGMIPSINSLMTVGLVALPGMMTGQILSGTDPSIAVRYQIVVMLMIAGSTALSSVLVVMLTRKRCFGSGQQLILKRGSGRG